MWRKRKIDSNYVIAFGVLLASIGSFLVSARQASILNEQTQILIEQSKANAWPILKIDVERSGSLDRVTEFSIMVSNKGNGPAIIKNVYLSYLGKEATDWYDFYNIIGLPDSVVMAHSNSRLATQVVLPGEKVDFVSWDGRQGMMDFIYPISENMVLTVYYESVFGDMWKAQRVGFRTNLEFSKNVEVSSDSIPEFKVFVE